MGRQTLLCTVLIFTGCMLLSCSNSGTGPNPGNGGEATTYNVNVSVSSAEAGSVSTSADGPYDEGETIELQAEPNEEYVFTHWSGDIDSTANNPLSLTVDQDYSLMANFEKKSYSLAIDTVGRGSVDENIVQAKDYESGTVVELMANPAEGYEFFEWKGDVTGAENPVQITVDEPKGVTAVFEKKSYVLTISTTGSGSVVTTPDQPTYEYGTTVEIEAVPASGFEFTGWTGAVSATDNPIQMTMDSSKEITAEFTEESTALFYLDENGVTLKCPDAGIGETGMVNGTLYKKLGAGAITPANAATTCTSGITDMRGLFSWESSFNGDISHWDVSSVTDMSKMFSQAESFNQDISSWDVSKVTNMRDMFEYAYAFNADISGWDVSSVQKFNRMFYYAKAFNQNLNNWDISSATTIAAMFHRAESFNSNLNNWDVSNLTHMIEVFYGAYAFNGDISTWDVSNVVRMDEMFAFATSFNRDISNWDVSSVLNMDKMFQNAESFNRDIASWDVSNVSQMYAMFYYAEVFEQDISSWCVPKIDFSPTDFASGAPLRNYSSYQPQWGGCASN